MAQAKAAFSLDRFKTEVLGKGLARNNRFEVLLSAPTALKNYAALSKTSLFVEVSNFPPLSLSVRQLRIYGPNFQRPVSSDYGGDGLSMTFHVDREMTIKSFFDDWLQFVVGTADDGWNVRYAEDYQSDIFLRQLDEQNNVTYEIKLVEAFPRSMNIMELNNSAQSQTHRLNIIFAYRYWEKTKDYAYYSPEKTEVPVVPFRLQPVIPPSGRGIEWNAGNEQGSFSESGSSDFAVGA